MNYNPRKHHLFSQVHCLQVIQGSAEIKWEILDESVAAIKLSIYTSLASVVLFFTATNTCCYLWRNQKAVATMLCNNSTPIPKWVFWQTSRMWILTSLLDLMTIFTYLLSKYEFIWLLFVGNKKIIFPQGLYSQVFNTIIYQLHKLQALCVHF